MQSSGLQARLLLVAAALLFSTGGAAIKATSLSGWQTAGFRSAVAAVALLLLVREARRGWTWSVLPVGLAYAATLVLFVHSTKLTTSANAIFLQSTAPAYLLILGPLLLKEPLGRRDLWFTLALIFGMGLFFYGTENPMATAPDPARGNLYALLSGLAWALTLAGLRWQAHSNPQVNTGLATVVMGNIFAFLIAAPRAFPVTHFGGRDVSVILFLGLVQIGLAYWCLTRGMRHVPAFESSTILLIEPVCNPIWSWFIHGEHPGVWSLAGGAVIILSTFTKIWSERRSVS
jgi:DME family drug/metabolite transporter